MEYAGNCVIIMAPVTQVVAQIVGRDARYGKGSSRLWVIYHVLVVLRE